MMGNFNPQLWMYLKYLAVLATETFFMFSLVSHIVSSLTQLLQVLLWLCHLLKCKCNKLSRFEYNIHFIKRAFIFLKKSGFFIRKLFHCKTSLQLRNICCLNNVKILDFDQFDQSSIFMLKTIICRLIWSNLSSYSASHIQFCYL